MKHFLIHQTVLWEKPDGTGKRVAYLQKDALLETVGNSEEYAPVETCDRKSGYVKTELLEQYTSPFPLYPENIRVPEDTEINDALNEHRAAQFIRLDSIGYRVLHRNLCGEFCVAAIAKQDVLPALAAWKESYSRADSILKYNRGTGTADLVAMLQAVGMNGDVVQYDGYRSFSSPRVLCETGLSIIGVGINAYGQIMFNGSTRHWVVVLKGMTQANDGWFQVYNPYWNRVEDVLFRDLSPKNALTLIQVYTEIETISRKRGR